MEQPQRNPFKSPSTESVSAGFDVRRQEMLPHVRSYVDTLYVQIRQIFDKYGVANIEDLRDGVKAKQIKMERQDGEKLKDLTRWLRDTLKERKIPPEYTEKTREYILHDIPDRLTMDSEKVLKDKTNGYKFDEIAQEFRNGRPMHEFYLTDKDLKLDGIKGENKRKILLERMDKAREPKESAVGKLFSISELITQTKAEDAEHPDRMENVEIWVALNAAGYRPATLEELLSFAKYHWRPEELEKDSFGQYVYTLGSGCTESYNDYHSIPGLTFSNGKRQLNLITRKIFSFAHRGSILAVKKD